MATYKVQAGDTLSSIAKKLGVKNWRDIYNANLKIIKNPNMIYKGQTLSIPGGKGSTAKAQTPSQQIASQYAKTVEDPTRTGFEKKYGLESEIRPDEAFMQFAEQQVNPYMLDLAQKQVREFDWSSAISGASASGMNTANRGDLVNQLNSDRLNQINSYIKTQNDLFSNWYNKELNAYTTAKNPSKYQLGKFGINVGGKTQNLTPTKTQYTYASPIDYQKQFAYGGYYSRPRTWGDIIKATA